MTPQDLILSPARQLELLPILLHLEKLCPCGARPENLYTPSHVAGCPIPRLIGDILRATGAVVH